MINNIPIGKVLIEYGYITEEQLQSALNQQKNDTAKRRLGAILIDYGYVTERQMLEALAQRMQLKLIDLNTYKIDANIVSIIPKHLAVKYNIICVNKSESLLTVVMSDPLNFYAVEDIRQITGLNLEILLAEKFTISNKIDFYYSEISAKSAAKSANSLAIATNVPEIEAQDGEGDVPVIKLLNSLLLRGHNANASDIHIEPFENQTVVRMRLDGMLIEYVTLSKALHQSLIARIKILSDLDIAEKRMPQDGHFKTKLEEAILNIRVSVIPTVYGEKAVLRFLFTDTIIDKASQFGMQLDDYQKTLKMLQSPNGIVYITGPTGSGKTTTLYMILEELSNKMVNISTIEDPVERNLPKINQMQVNNLAGLSFESGLRSLLRQDPDIIMVGETRDNLTATISVRSAITGHLVLSTLHTNDAVSTIVRLKDMGIEPYLIANSLVGVIAQRLVRKVCLNCSYKEEPTEEIKTLIGNDIPYITKSKGCHLCNNTGYKGRIAIHEILTNDKIVRKMITEEESIDSIVEYAITVQQMKTLIDSALRLVKEGITTVDEFLRIAYFTL